MGKDAWIELPRHRYDKVWDRFDAAFDFKPSVRPADWPSFREPVPSVTWNISDLLAAFYPWRDPLAAPYNLALLKALVATLSQDEPVLALDWQHASYAFHPHRLREPQEPANWRIPALPSGEYHIFVSEDFRLGSLGHPWEGTLCVFGAGFLDAYRLFTPLGDDRVVRRQVPAAEERPSREPKRQRGQASPRRRFRRRT
jgi:hypothetical protein